MTKLITIFTIMLTLAACAVTQTATRPGIEISPGQIAVINETDSLGAIYIGDKAGNFLKLEIDPGEVWISPSFRGRPHVRIYYGEHFEEYLLMTGLKYRLYQDIRKNRLDIRMIR